MPPVRVKVGEGWYVDDAAGTADDVAGDDGDHPRRDDRDHGDAHDEHPDAARTSPIARNPDRLSRAVGGSAWVELRLRRKKSPLEAFSQLDRCTTAAAATPGPRRPASVVASYCGFA